MQSRQVTRPQQRPDDLVDIQSQPESFVNVDQFQPKMYRDMATDYSSYMVISNNV